MHYWKNRNHYLYSLGNNDSKLMGTLKVNWLTEGLIDFEYKKYLILGYIKSVKESFNKSELYPDMADLLFHYKNLMSVKEKKQLLYANFPTSISQSDFLKLKLNYEKIVEDDYIMREIEDILAFSIPQFSQIIREGKDIYEFVENSLSIAPIGLSPLYKDEGYFFIDEEYNKELPIFRYQVTVFENSEETYRGINVEYVASTEKSIGKTLESVKIGLVKTFRFLPNPATFVIYSKFRFPFEATLMPIAKRMLVKHLSQIAA